MIVKSFVKDGKPVTQDRDKILQFFTDNENREIYTIYLPAFDMRDSRDVTLENMKLYYKEVVLPQIHEVTKAQSLSNQYISDWLSNNLFPITHGIDSGSPTKSIEAYTRIEMAQFLDKVCTWAEKEYGLRMKTTI